MLFASLDNSDEEVLLLVTSIVKLVQSKNYSVNVTADYLVLFPLSGTL